MIFTFTNSGSLPNVASMTFLSTRMYFLDQFAGSAGTSINGWDSNALPGISGSPYTVTGSIELDGDGMTFMSAGSSAQALAQVTLPAYNPVTASFEVTFDIEQMSDVASWGGIYLMASTGDSMILILDYIDGPPRSFIVINGNLISNSQIFIVPAVGVRWHMKLDFVTGAANFANTYLYYSIDNINWKTLWNVGFDPTTLPTSYAIGPYFSGASGTETTGVHVGNIVAQDISPASPNCQVSDAYVTSSGQSAMLFYETISGNTPVYPSALNFPLTFFQNGTLLDPAKITYWIGSGALCAGILFPPGIQVLATDTVTMLAPSSAIALGTGNASAAVTTPYTLTNYGPQSSTALGSGSRVSARTHL